MAGFSRFYVFGGSGGYLGADGANPIAFLILVGDADRQWFEPHYFNASFKPIGEVSTMVPTAPDHPDALLDACIAFSPSFFESCPSLAEVEEALRGVKRLDFDAAPEKVPDEWAKLREEARPLFAELNIWQADLVPINET